jgi:hypothetical protein
VLVVRVPVVREQGVLERVRRAPAAEVLAAAAPAGREQGVLARPVPAVEAPVAVVPAAQVR